MTAGHLLFALAVVAVVIGLQFLPRRSTRPLDPDEPTAKQINYARFLGVTIPQNCSRKELSRLIDRAKRG